MTRRTLIDASLLALAVAILTLGAWQLWPRWPLPVAIVAAVGATAVLLGIGLAGVLVYERLEERDEERWP